MVDDAAAAPTRLAPAEAALVAVARVEEVPPGWVLRTVARGRDVAVANSGGSIYAFDHSCPHAGGPLGDNRLLDGCTVECPWHNAAFDVRSGDVVRGPARKPLRSFGVVVKGGTIYVDLDRAG